MSLIRSFNVNKYIYTYINIETPVYEFKLFYFVETAEVQTLKELKKHLEELYFPLRVRVEVIVCFYTQGH